jgi:hypothetical protein
MWDSIDRALGVVDRAFGWLWGEPRGVDGPRGEEQGGLHGEGALGRHRRGRGDAWMEEGANDEDEGAAGEGEGRHRLQNLPWTCAVM